MTSKITWDGRSATVGEEKERDEGRKGKMWEELGREGGGEALEGGERCGERCGRNGGEEEKKNNQEK